MGIVLTRQEATELLEKQPVGTFMLSAPNKAAAHRGWTASVWRRTPDGWGGKAQNRNGGHEYQSAELAPILLKMEDDQFFIWSFS